MTSEEEAGFQKSSILVYSVTFNLATKLSFKNMVICSKVMNTSKYIKMRKPYGIDFISIITIVYPNITCLGQIHLWTVKRLL